jgi:hypothetical protein
VKVNVYVVQYHTIFETHQDGVLKETRRTSPTQALAAAKTPQEAFALMPVIHGDRGEIARNVNLGVQEKHRGVLVPDPPEAIGAT